MRIRNRNKEHNIIHIHEQEAESQQQRRRLSHFGVSYLSLRSLRSSERRKLFTDEFPVYLREDPTLLFLGGVTHSHGQLMFLYHCLDTPPLRTLGLYRL